MTAQFTLCEPNIITIIEIVLENDEDGEIAYFTVR